MRASRAERNRRWVLAAALALTAVATAEAQQSIPTQANHAAKQSTPETSHHAEARVGLDSAAHRIPHVTLTATEAVGEVSGRLELLPVPSPFDIAVTTDGSQRYRTRFVVQGLPEPSSLGPYTVYVAWMVSWFLEEGQRLGPIENGAGELAEVQWNKFRILVTAEARPSAREPTGPVVLRGLSPSGRLLPSATCNLSLMGLC